MGERLGLRPLGAFRGMAFAGCEPDKMGAGPVFAVPRLLARHGLNCRGWRIVTDEALDAPAPTEPDLTVVKLKPGDERGDVVAAWMRRHNCHAALVRPDHYTYGTASTAGELADLLQERTRNFA